MIIEERREEVIVLKVVPYREIDCIVHFFSERQGKLSGFAFGGLKSQKRFSGSLEQLNHIILVYQEYPNYISLKESFLVRRFSNIHRDSYKYGIAINCVKFVESVHKGPFDSKRVFKLILDLLELLDSVNKVPFYLPLIFRARLCSEYGYSPTLDKCFDCSRELSDSGGVFFMNGKKIRCKKCAYKRRRGIFLSPKEINVLKSIFNDGLDLCGEIKKVDERKILRFLDEFVYRNLGDFFKRGLFIQT